MKEKVFGVMGAMQEEIDGVIGLLKNRREVEIGMRKYYTGEINGVKMVVVFSRWGKVAATTTVATLIMFFKVDAVIFTGVAGAIHSSLRIGDIVIGKRLMQHDMNASPMVPKFEVPLHRQTFFECDSTLLAIASESITELLKSEKFDNYDLAMFDIDDPQLFIGDIASGDQFFSTTKQKTRLRKSLPTILCVEMEGAAVAQICFEYNIPWIVIRTISDVADEKSHVDFQSFIQKIASHYSTEIIRKLSSKE